MRSYLKTATALVLTALLTACSTDKAPLVETGRLSSLMTKSIEILTEDSKVPTVLDVAAVKIETNEKDNIKVGITYHTPRGSVGSIVYDTKTAVRGVIAALRYHDISPRESRIRITAWAREPAGIGETGQKLIRVFGHSRYNHDQDSINFHEFK